MSGDSIFAGTMAEMTYPQVEAAAGRGAAVVLPVGVIEEHGPHLPLGTDVYAAYQLARLVRRYGGERGHELLICPPLYWGVNQVTGAFHGSFRIRPETALALLVDVLDTLVQDGFERIFVINHHGDFDHNAMVRDALRDQHRRGRGRIRWLEGARMIERLGDDGSESIWAVYEHRPELEALRTTGVLGVHAHEIETALMTRYFPELVDFDALGTLEATDLDEDDLRRWRKGGEEARAVTPQGYFGAPRPVDPELWRQYDITARAMTDAIDRIAR